MITHVRKSVRNTLIVTCETITGTDETSISCSQYEIRLMSDCQSVEVERVGVTLPAY